jgi:hypothetical protein
MREAKELSEATTQYYAQPLEVRLDQACAEVTVLLLIFY